MNQYPLSSEQYSPRDTGLPRWSRRRFTLGLCLLIAMLILIIYCIHRYNTKPIKSDKGTLVVLAKVQQKNLPVTISALGNVTPTYTVTVRTQVNGLLMKVLYKEGQFVKKGDLLVEIDQRPLLAQLMQYQGQLVRDQALLDKTLIDLKRYQTLWKQDSVSQQTLATQDALVRQYRGDVETDKGLIESTQVNLMYCHIISPINGRVGLRLVDPGNFVQTSDTTGLVVITTINPITVIFTIPEDDVPKLVPKVFLKKNLLVEAYDRQQRKLLSTGTLLTIDNIINTTTGTVKLRARFTNKDNQLFPNQFVNIKLVVDTLTDAVVIPTAGIQHGNKGDFVYLYNPDSTVTMQYIKTGLTSGNDTVIQEGLMFGQQIVVDGADKLTNGAKIRLSTHKQTSVLAGKNG